MCLVQILLYLIKNIIFVDYEKIVNDNVVDFLFFRIA